MVPHPFQVVGVEEVAHHPCQVGAVGVVQIPSQVEGEVVVVQHLLGAEVVGEDHHPLGEVVGCKCRVRGEGWGVCPQASLHPY